MVWHSWSSLLRRVVVVGGALFLLFNPSPSFLVVPLVDAAAAATASSIQHNDNDNDNDSDTGVETAWEYHYLYHELRRRAKDRQKQKYDQEPHQIVDDDGSIRKCKLGACYIEHNPADDYIVPDSAWVCQDLRSDCSERASVEECLGLGMIAAECPKTCSSRYLQQQQEEEGVDPDHIESPGWFWCGDRIRTIPIHPDNLPLLLVDEIPRGSAYDAPMVEGVGSDYGVLQMVGTADNTEFRSRIIDRAIQVGQYMKGILLKTREQKILKSCRNRNEMCMFWAVVGECSHNPDYMLSKCGPACFHCPDDNSVNDDDDVHDDTKQGME